MSIDVFVVEMNNGECYEDFHWWISGIFSTELLAKIHLNQLGFKWKKADKRYTNRQDQYSTYYADIKTYTVDNQEDLRV